MLEGLAVGLFANSAVGQAVEIDDGGAVSCLVEVADGRVVGSTEDLNVGEFLISVGAVEGFLVGPSDGCDGLLVGDSDDG